MYYSRYKAFTLVELIVVVTILAILATIGFVSYSSYLTGVRDTNRLAQLVSIHDGLELYRTKKDLPLPDDNIEVKLNGSAIAYQGNVGANVLETIDFTKGGKDPRDGSYFSYYLTEDRKYFQLLAFLEEESSKTSYIKGIFPTIYAVDLKNRIPVVYGKKLGILINNSNSPVQNIDTLQTAGEINLTDTNLDYRGILTDDVILDGSSIMLINPVASCKRIKQMKGGSEDGIYFINPTGTAAFEVYCDMTTDGGGWTYATMLSDSITANLFDTGNTNKITSLTTDISTKGTLTDIWKYNDNKDIMIKCSVDNDFYSSYESPLIIYGYNKLDIINLEKTTKQATVFSSVKLEGKYKSKKFIFDTMYAGSSHASSFYLKESGTNKVIFMNLRGTSLFKTNTATCATRGLCYDANTYDDILLDESNYCMTAVRSNTSN